MNLNLVLHNTNYTFEIHSRCSDIHLETGFRPTYIN